MRPEHDVAGNSPRLADQHLWSAEDEIGSEEELRLFLYAIIRMLKPPLVVETGCYTGWGTLAMSSAVKSNGNGRLISCDIDPGMAEGASLLISDMASIATIYPCSSCEIREEIGCCDFLFSDSDPKIRPEEVSWLKPGAIAVVHDTYVYPELGEFVKSQVGILFDTPRGFGIIRK